VTTFNACQNIFFSVHSTLQILADDTLCGILLLNDLTERSIWFWHLILATTKIQIFWIQVLSFVNAKTKKKHSVLFNFFIHVEVILSCISNTTPNTKSYTNRFYNETDGWQTCEHLCNIRVIKCKSQLQAAKVNVVGAVDCVRNSIYVMRHCITQAYSDVMSYILEMWWSKKIFVFV